MEEPLSAGLYSLAVGGMLSQLAADTCILAPGLRIDHLLARSSYSLFCILTSYFERHFLHFTPVPPHSHLQSL